MQLIAFFLAAVDTPIHTRHSGPCFCGVSTYGRNDHKLRLIAITNASRQNRALSSWFLSAGSLLCMVG